jgi:hypothetical protein
VDDLIAGLVQCDAELEVLLPVGISLVEDNHHLHEEEGLVVEGLSLVSEAYCVLRGQCF